MEQFLKQLANDHQVDLNSVFSELCEWAFSNAEGKKQFKLWLDDAFPPKGEAEIKHRPQAPQKEPVKKIEKKSPKKKLMKTKTTTRTSPEKTSKGNSIPKLGDQSFLTYVIF